MLGSVSRLHVTTRCHAAAREPACIHSFTHCCRCPDGLSVLLVADFGVRMTAWSLLDRRCAYLPGPKHAAKGLAFDPAGGCMAVLEVRMCTRCNACLDCLMIWHVLPSRKTRNPSHCTRVHTSHLHPHHCSARSARTGWHFTTTQAAAAAAAAGACAAGRRCPPCCSRMRRGRVGCNKVAKAG